MTLEAQIAESPWVSTGLHRGSNALSIRSPEVFVATEPCQHLGNASYCRDFGQDTESNALKYCALCDIAFPCPKSPCSTDAQPATNGGEGVR